MSDGSIPDSSAYVYVDRYTTDDSDSLNYDNGSVRYNYDVVKGGPHDDVSGQGGLGYTTEDSDVYVSGHFDEATGKVGGRVDLEHAISPDTVFDSHFAIDNDEKTDGHVGLTHLIDEGKAVRGEFGYNEAEGDYVDAQYESQFEGGSDSIKFRGSEKNGSSIEYNGARSGDDWDLGLNLKADDDGKLTGNLAGEKRFELNEDTSGRVYGDTDLEGNWQAGADITRVLSDDAGVQAGMELNHEGKASGYVTHVHGENYESVGIEVNEKGEESYSYSGHHVSGALTTDESMTIDKDGKVDGQIAATYDEVISETRSRVYNGTIRADGSWNAGVNQFDKVSNNVEFHNGVALDSEGKLSGEHNVLVTTLEGNGYVGAGVGWDSNGGRTANASGGYAFEGGSTVDAEASWDGKDYRGSMNNGVVISDNTTLTSGLTYDGATKSLGVNAGVGYMNPEDKVSAGVGIGYASNNFVESGSLTGDIAFADVLGQGSSIGLGVVAEEDVYKRKEAMPTSEMEYLVRSEVLANEPEGTKFVEYGARRKLAADFSTGFSIGTGYVEAGLSAGEEYDVRFFKLATDPRLDETPTENEMQVPNTADKVLAMKAGESFSITGGSHQGVRGGGGLGFSTGPLSISGGIDAGVLVSGRLSTEVLKGSDGSARLVLSKADGKTADGGLKVTVGLSPEALVGDAIPSFPDVDPKGPIIGVFFQLLLSIIGRFLSFGGRIGKEGSDGDSRLVDCSLDLSKPDVQRAYNKAMRGDWSDIEKMAKDGHPGVDMDRSIFTDMTRKSVPFALNAFGFFFNRESSETLKDSDVITDSGTYQVESDRDENTQSKGGMFKNTSYTVADVSRDVELIDGEMAGVKQEENWLSWKREHKDTFASREEVAEQLDLAMLLGDSGTQAAISGYRERMSAVKDRRKLWIGPRNEMRRTTVSTKVVVSDAGLDELSGIELNQLWDAYATNWLKLNPHAPRPLWTSAAGRDYLLRDSGDIDVLLEQAEMLTVHTSLEAMVSATQIADDDKRHDAIRKTLFSDMSDEALVASVALLAGAEHIRLELKVDSAAGTTGAEHDLSINQVGGDFDVQRHVFGQAL